MATRMGFGDENRNQAADFMQKMYNLFVEKDATLIEINPMSEDSDGNGVLLSFHCMSIYCTRVDTNK